MRGAHSMHSVMGVCSSHSTACTPVRCTCLYLTSCADPGARSASCPCCCAVLCCVAQVLNPFGSNTQTFRYWEPAELQDLVNTVGLTDYRFDRSRMYIMFAATKPHTEH